MPAVTVLLSEASIGDPNAMTHCPTLIWSESPISTNGNSSASILITATSLTGSAPTTRASYSVPSMAMTASSSIFSMTWLFVRMCPSGRIMTPDPSPVRGVGGVRNSKSRKKSPKGVFSKGFSCGSFASRALGMFSVRICTTAGLTRSTTCVKASSSVAALGGASGSGARTVRVSGSALLPKPNTLAPIATNSPPERKTAAMTASEAK